MKKKNHCKKLTSFTLLLFIALLGFNNIQSSIAQSNSVTLISSGWKLKAQSVVTDSGQQLATTGYNSNTWITAEVPGTVFGSYVKAGLEVDPNFGDNIYTLDKKKYDRNHWYRCEFKVPQDFTAKKVWLNFDGINRDADIYLNGNKIGNIRGYLQRGRFDVTSLIKIGGNNALAVLVYLPVLPTANSASPTFICSRGWDWMPYVPGLNMGIWNDVYLSNTGSVSIIDPWIRTKLPLPFTDKANVSIKMDLKNNQGSSQSGTLIGTINPGNITFSQKVSLKANETKTITLDNTNFSQLTINNPKLWWPNGYGAPNLYTCNLKFQVKGTISDLKDIKFGIKQYSYDTIGNVLKISINGVRVFLKGGNWGMSEYMLRCQKQEYYTKVRLHQEMNYNMIRNWTGEVGDDEFYDACDKYGIMVWDEFPLNYWASQQDGYHPRDNDLFNANAIEKIKRFRNHPSVALWCGENEGVPVAPLDEWMRTDVKIYDENDRYYQSCSNSGNLSGSGPWNNLSPADYFTSDNPGLHSEIGTAVFTTFESFKKFIPESHLWPRNQMWDFHFFGKSAINGGPDKYEGDLNFRYGAATGIEDFCRKAQLLNLETSKAIYEGWIDRMWNNASGVIFWMSQSAYPSMVWQTYDYYYDLTGAYWGAKKGCEPVHIYWNCSNDLIRVANTSNSNYNELTAETWIYNMDGTQKYYNSAVIGSTSNTVTNCFKISYPSDLSDVHFIKLKLKNSSGTVISDNFYWRGKVLQEYSALNDIGKVNLSVTSTKQLVNGKYVINTTIGNPTESGSVALAIWPKVVNASSGKQVLPVFMNDGYFSLLPGETKKITIQFDATLLGNESFNLAVECWNNYAVPASFPVFNPNTLYQLKCKSGKVLGAVDGANAIQAENENDNISQQWKIVDEGGGYFKLINRKSGKVLDNTGSIANGSAVVQEDDHLASPNQRWKIVAIPGRYYFVMCQSSSKALENANSEKNGTNITQANYMGNDDQKWTIEPYKRKVAVIRAVSSSNDQANIANNVFDGIGSTRWASAANDNEWIYVDLGMPRNINRVILRWENAFGKSYKIQTSNDAVNWKDVYNGNNGEEGNKDITFPVTSARYVRMLGVLRGTQWGYSLWEFEVYETLNATQMPDAFKK